MVENNMSELKKKLVAEANESRRMQIESEIKREILKIMHSIDSYQNGIDSSTKEIARLRKILSDFDVPEVKDIEV